MQGMNNIKSSFVVSVHPFISPHKKLGSLWKDFREILYLSIFENSIGKNQVSLKYYKNNMYSTLHEDQYTFLVISLSVLLIMINVSDKSCVENQNTHFMFNNSFSKTVLLMK
jgi:hypothetical protein